MSSNKNQAFANNFLLTIYSIFTVVMYLQAKHRSDMLDRYPCRCRPWCDRYCDFVNVVINKSNTLALSSICRSRSPNQFLVAHLCPHGTSHKGWSKINSFGVPILNTGKWDNWYSVSADALRWGIGAGSKKLHRCITIIHPSLYHLLSCFACEMLGFTPEFPPH